MLFYHYCSCDTFLSIINSKTLWLSNIIRSNDSEEVSRTYKIIWDRIKGKLYDGMKELEYGKEKFETLNSQLQFELSLMQQKDEVPFGVCLTLNRDISHSWNEYGDHSKGLALGFSDQIFYGIPHKSPHPSSVLENSIGYGSVIYDRNDLGDNFLSLFLNELRSDKSGWGIWNIRTTIKHYSAFIKNPAFKDEREIRIIYYPQYVESTDSLSEVSGIVDTPFPHCTLPWKKSTNMCALKEIIIGTNCEYNQAEIQNLLYENGLNDDIAIYKSEYPCQISKNRP